MLRLRGMAGALVLMVGIAVAFPLAADEDAEHFDDMEAEAVGKASADQPAFVAGGRNPASVAPGGQMTFQVRLSNPQAVRLVEVLFPDAAVAEPMDRIAPDTWRRLRAMSRAGDERPYQFRVTSTAGKVVTSGTGRYSVGSSPAPQQSAQMPRPLAVTAADASANSVRVGDTVRFTAATNVPAARVDVMFDHPQSGTRLPMQGGGTAWSLAHTMSLAGNRSYWFMATAASGQQVWLGPRTLLVVATNPQPQSQLQPQPLPVQQQVQPRAQVQPQLQSSATVPAQGGGDADGLDLDALLGNMTEAPQPGPAVTPGPVLTPIPQPVVPIQNPAATLIPTRASVAISNPAPMAGQRVSVALRGTLANAAPSDVYLYIKKAEQGALFFWHGRRLNDMPAPWRASVVGPNWPADNPVLSFDVRQPGTYAAGVVILPAGAAFRMDGAIETPFTVR